MSEALTGKYIAEQMMQNSSWSDQQSVDSNRRFDSWMWSDTGAYLDLFEEGESAEEDELVAHDQRRDETRRLRRKVQNNKQHRECNRKPSKTGFQHEFWTFSFEPEIWHTFPHELEPTRLDPVMESAFREYLEAVEDGELEDDRVHELTREEEWPGEFAHRVFLQEHPEDTALFQDYYGELYEEFYLASLIISYEDWCVSPRNTGALAMAGDFDDDDNYDNDGGYEDFGQPGFLGSEEPSLLRESPGYNDS